MQDGHSGSCVQINRPLYENEQLRRDFDYDKYHNSPKFRERAENLLNAFQIKRAILTTLPILKWLKHYDWKSHTFQDIAAGFTVAIMHIPQGMAYGLLGNVPPIIGIYMAFFPVLIYTILGTSRHISMGTFAVVCLMTGKAVLEHSNITHHVEHNNYTNLLTEEFTKFDGHSYSAIQVATAVTFTVALCQIAMYVLRLGAISAVLSETLVSGFTTGAAFQVLVSQLKDILGVTIKSQKGNFVVINTLKSLIENIDTVNYVALVIAAITIITCTLNNELLKPIIAKRSHFPVPIELIVIVIGTLVSKYCNFQTKYGIAIVGKIPKGLPTATLPPLSLVQTVFWDSITIAIVSYSISVSLALIFAHKESYEINPNQELLAQGAGNLFGCFFSCMPFTASLSRSSIQYTSGGKTQLVSFVSCAILLVVLLWIGPFFTPLPKSVLAGMIIAALKSMLFQVKEIQRFWKLSRIDAIVWLVTFLTVLLVAIDIGLLIGVVFSLISVFVLTSKPRAYLLGVVPHTDLYVNVDKYKRALEIQGIKIFHYCGAINFITKNMFKHELTQLIKMDPMKQAAYQQKLRKYELYTSDEKRTSDHEVNKMNKLRRKINTELKCVIIDFSSVNYIDPSGAVVLKGLTENFQKIDVDVYFACCSDHVYNMISKCDLFEKKQALRTFPTVHDAVEFSTEILVGSSNISYISRL